MPAFSPQRDAPGASRARRAMGAPAVRKGKRSLWLRAFLAIVRHPGRSLLILAGAALVGSVLVNALFLQKGRHPAPLFVASSTSTPSQPVSFSAPPAQTRASADAPAAEPFFAPEPMPASRLAPQGGQSQTPPSQLQPPVRPAPVQKPAPARIEGGDAIGALLRGSPQASSPHVAAQDPVQAKRIVAAQRALEKLGFQVVADGLAGPGTRAAIQKFERERDLPVTGELNPRTLRALAARSGVSIP